MAKNHQSAAKKLIQRDGTRCHYCGVELVFSHPIHAKITYTVDHIQPVSKGGTDALENLVLACRSCNSTKRDKDYGEFVFTRDMNSTLLFLMGENHD